MALKQAGKPQAQRLEYARGALRRKKEGRKTTTAGLDVLPLRETQQFRGVEISLHFARIQARATCKLLISLAEAELELAPGCHLLKVCGEFSCLLMRTPDSQIAGYMSSVSWSIIPCSSAASISSPETHQYLCSGAMSISTLVTLLPVHTAECEQQCFDLTFSSA